MPADIIPTEHEHLPAGALSEQEVLDRGKRSFELLQQLGAAEKKSRDWWEYYGQALAVGKRKYPALQDYGQWVRDNGFDQYDSQTNSDALWWGEHRAEVESVFGIPENNSPGDIRKAYRKQLKQEERKQLIAEIEERTADITGPSGLFDVIVIDPPWAYDEKKPGESYDPDGRRASNPYPEMSLEEIAEIDLPAADDCVLWLWTTHKFMRHSFNLLDGWGFQDKAIVTWVKDRMGLGSWLRSQSEFCIMAVKGRPIIQLSNQTTIVHGPLREHSRKPDEFYDMVDSLCVGRKIDWFSRETRTGWVQFGNDEGKFNAV
jgi:N6-adenosine-specific RNA methylase IME4